MFDRLNKLKAELDACPLPESLVANLREDWLLRLTYHSNAIEGNTLTLLETKVVLEGITVGGKTLREHFEALNHREAIFFVEDLVNDPEGISDRNIRNLHQLVLKQIDDQHAGIYRNLNVRITGARHEPCDHTQVKDRIAALMAWYSESRLSFHPVELAAELHAEFVGVHPFVDGNGRTGRLLMNLTLMQTGFPPAIITVEQRLAYYQALDAWLVDKDRAPFIALLKDALEKSFAINFKALG
jgi:Fic family protein